MAQKRGKGSPEVFRSLQGFKEPFLEGSWPVAVSALMPAELAAPAVNAAAFVCSTFAGTAGGDAQVVALADLP